MRSYRSLRDDMSQDELSKLVGVTTGAISQIERGVNQPRRETAQAIDDALAADGAILEAFGYVIPQSADEPAGIQEFRRQAMEAILDLSRQVRELRDEVDEMKRGGQHSQGSP
jgi:transcriptional regulator with XRE-family HTH domain